VEVNDAAAETPFIQQLELQVDAVGEPMLAASDHDGHEKQVTLVHQPRPERLGGEIGTAHADAFICRIASGSKARSIRVLALDTVSNVLEYTTFSAARHISAKSCSTGWSATVWAVSQ